MLAHMSIPWLVSGLEGINNDTYDTMNPIFWSASEGSKFLVCAVVMVTAVNAISRQAVTQAPARTLGGVALFICRGH